MNIIKDRLISTFFDLVKIDSPSGFEDGVRSYIQRRLTKLNIFSEIDRSGNLYCKVQGQGEPLVLCAHMDTVEPGRNINPVLKNGLIKSDGSTILGADNKVAIAAILEMLEMRKQGDRALEIVFSVREETDGGINEFDFKKLKGKTGIIADRASAIGSIVYTSPWIYNLTIEIIGKTAHSGMPENGINALTVAASAITKIKLGRVDSKTTINIGLISGGTAMNSVPGKIELVGEVRSFSNIIAQKYLKVIEDKFRSETSKTGAKLIVSKSIYCNGYCYDKDENSIKKVNEVNNKISVKTNFEVSFGASDANTFIKNGIKMVNVGDGSKNPHTINESITVTNLVKLTELFCTYVSI